MSVSLRTESASISQFSETSSKPQAAIAAAFPQFREARLTPIGEGWDFRLYELDSGWLFRFPKRQECIAKLEVECKLLLGLAEHLSLPVPRYRWISGLHGKPGPPFAGYRKLPGIPGDRAEHVDRPALARQLGAFLHHLHSYPVTLARAAGAVAERDLASCWGARSLDQLPTVQELPLDTTRLRRYLQDDIPPPYEGIPVLIHNDLWAEHVLVDPSTGRANGIIDWGDVAIGDPAVDFAFLLAWLGDDWMREVLRHYGEKMDTIPTSRVRYLATCLAVHIIALGEEMDHLAWIAAGQTALKLIHRK